MQPGVPRGLLESYGRPGSAGHRGNNKTRRVKASSVTRAVTPGCGPDGVVQSSPTWSAWRRKRLPSAAELNNHRIRTCDAATAVRHNSSACSAASGLILAGPKSVFAVGRRSCDPSYHSVSISPPGIFNLEHLKRAAPTLVQPQVGRFASARSLGDEPHRLADNYP